MNDLFQKFENTFKEKNHMLTIKFLPLISDLIEQ